MISDGQTENLHFKFYVTKEPNEIIYTSLVEVVNEVVNDASLTLKAFKIGKSLIVLGKCHMKGGGRLDRMNLRENAICH